MDNKIPNDPHILCSYVNMMLRDRFDSLEGFCVYRDVDAEEIKGRLEEAGYTYDATVNQFR